MVEQQEIDEVLGSILDKDELILATLSSPRAAQGISKATIRPLLIKGNRSYQITENRQKQAFHQNVSKEDCLHWLRQYLPQFKQSFFYTASADYHVLIGKKGNWTLLKKVPSKAPRDVPHNRSKQYVLQEGKPIPFLVKLGVMNAEGKVYAAKADKFRQINRFLEMIDDILPHLEGSKPLHIVDFGCGKSYLTFALYHFLKVAKGYQVHLTGIDLKDDVIQYCQKLAHELGYQEDLQFIRGDIDHYQTQEEVDLVVSLHACDTATDAALEKAIRWQSKVILSVPCCQHELLPQIQQELLRPLLKHGILKERFAALATDAVRVQLLEVLGYQAQILEFIDVEHTPKNLLIRAVKRPPAEGHQQSTWQAYLKFKHMLNIQPCLERRFQAELAEL